MTIAANRDPSDFREQPQSGADFLGAFAVLRKEGRILMVENSRYIDGRDQRTWDLPGGQVEPGELLLETLARELTEETGLQITGTPEFLFVQEGEKKAKGLRTYAWRSFFFEVEEFHGVPSPKGEILDLRWMAREDLDQVLNAPYHDSFRIWLEKGGRHFHSVWEE